MSKYNNFNHSQNVSFSKDQEEQKKQDVLITCSFVRKASYFADKEYVISINRPRKKEEIEKKRHKKSMRKNIIPPLRKKIDDGEMMIKWDITDWLKKLKAKGYSISDNRATELSEEIFTVLTELKKREL